MAHSLKAAFVILLIVLFGEIGHAEPVDELTFITEEYAPLNFVRAGRLQGIAVDTLEEMLKAVGARKTRQDFVVQPWARGYKTALEKKGTVLFAMTRTPARESLFKWVGPIVPSRIVLLAKKSRHIGLESAADLNRSGFTIAAVRDDVAAQTLAELGVKPEKILLTNSGPGSARMLSADRFDLWAYGENEALWYLKELGADARDYESALTLRESQQYIALHRDVDERTVRELQAALDGLRASGKLDEIVQRYLR